MPAFVIGRMLAVHSLAHCQKALRIALSLLAVVSVISSASLAFGQKVNLTLDSSEADAAIAILQKESAGTVVAAADWDALFSSVPYQRLKMREASIGAPFTDDAFKSFLAAPETIARTEALSKTLQAWKQANMESIGERDLSYLPPDAQIHAKVYPEIKPAANSFVWGSGDDRAIFLYLNPSLNKAQFENKVAHESHHIGVDSLSAEEERAIAGLSDAQKRAVRWLGGFGEGEAMLAAAGSPSIHPHALDDEAARAQWDNDMQHFAENLAAVQQFLLDILDKKLTEPNAIEQRAEPFYGQQGAWYTVGYRMASLVEVRFGRQALTSAMADPRKLLVLYNRAASEQNEQQGTHLTVWSSELLQRLGAG